LNRRSTFNYDRATLHNPLLGYSFSLSNVRMKFPRMTHGERSPLSRRERKVVSLVAQGYRNKEIAEKLFISEQTAKNHLHNIFGKLGISDRLAVTLYAIHNGLHLQQ
jgi:DNA-binding NarL/FixJ family response regulator